MYRKLVIRFLFLFCFLSFFSSSAYAATYYIAPDKDLDGTSPNIVGTDSNPGTLAQPIKTFNKAWQLLYPGDTLLLMDGIYLQTMAPNVRDGAPNTAVTAGDNSSTGQLNPLYPLDHPERTKNYITIKAQNDGKPIIDGENQRSTVMLGNYQQGWKGNYFILEGFIAENSSDNVYFIQSHNVIVRRCSGYNANTHQNVGIFETSTGGSSEDPSNILLEDNFASGVGRKMFMAYGSYVNIIFRRNVGYIKDVPFCDQACQNDWPNGDNIEIYNWNQQDLTNNSIVENNIALGGGPTYGFSLTPNPARTIGNKFLGDISIHNGMNLDGSYRVWSCTNMASACQTQGTKCAANGSTDWTYHRTGFQFGIYANPFFKNNTFQDLFAWGNASFGLTAGGNWCNGTEPAGTYPCARCNPVEINPNENCTPGQITASERSSGNLLNRITLVQNSIASASPYNNSGIEAPSEVFSTFRDYGTIGGMYIEGNSTYPDKNKGARLRYRYVNGILMDGTNGQPAQELWPWPMEQRIKDELAREFGIQNYSVTNTVVPLINQYTAEQVILTGSPTPTPSCGLPGDLNCDKKVTIADLTKLLSNFSKPVSGYSEGDISGDGKVTITDLVTLLTNFGR